ncbi:hypothetical protein JCM10213_006759 [Rhodosporidiobolus nylandii]
MAHDHSHSHSHTHGGHTHNGGSGGHGHSHGVNPYDRECQAPTTASTYCFVAAFLGALASVSLPTHITGYFLPTVSRTSLLWSTVALGAIYAVLCVVCFFAVLGEATSESYRAPLASEVEEEESTRKMRMLSWISRAAAGCLVGTVGMSVALFALGLRFSAEEWNEWCAQNSVVFVASTGSSESHDAAVRTVCDEMHSNAQYLVLGMPGLLLLVELLRFVKTSQFVKLALDRPKSNVSGSFEPLREADSGAPFEGDELRARLRAMQELGRRRRRERRSRARRYQSDSEEALLSV